MTANFLHVKVSSNEMVGIHSKNSSILLRPTKIQGLNEDLVYSSKALSRTPEVKIIDEMNCDAENIYLKAVIEIITKLMCK